MRQPLKDFGGKLQKPNIIFIFGFCYYFFLPPVALKNFSDNIVIAVATLWMDVDYYDWAYYLDGVVIISSWLLGMAIGKFLPKNKSFTIDYIAIDDGYAKYYIFSLIGLAILFFIVSIKSGAQFFVGYDDYRIEVLGPFSGLLFTTIFFRNFFDTEKSRKYLLLIIIFCGSILIGLGNRMFTVMACLSLVFDYLSRHVLTLKQKLAAVVFTIFMFFFMIYVGVKRVDMDLNFSNYISVFIAEPLYTGMSFNIYLVYFFERPVFSIPYDVIAGFLNFIPSILFPEKTKILKNIVYDFETAPAGASAMLYSMYVNFGYFYPLFLVGLSAYYSNLWHKAAYSRFHRAVYLSALPLLAFYIHRESLSTTVKLLVFNGFFFPLATLFFLHLSLKFFGKKQKIQTRDRCITE